MKKQFVKEDKKGRKEIWEWEESPKTLAAIALYHSQVAKRNATSGKA